ncbi:DUF397 domain-containing protein [Actinocorallia sp. API 0066]|uniref:DUF397 domain-containing protein n=1 Tax=Actinocorallia sp. API 0066 TaxID=2896846 RepID=UPI001E507CCE|nr:DUF397 domain-containing protein [Actinocorallia sp. API 0066]MCD0448864.1 DUF397 domain-containing protein [Actinocorallia sp. API 0066]
MSGRPTWRKSSYSGPQGGDCVEVAPLPGAIGVRDSKNPHHSHHTLTPKTFRTMIQTLKAV